jgi:hypothetical protein
MQCLGHVNDLPSQEKASALYRSLQREDFASVQHEKLLHLLQDCKAWIGSANMEIQERILPAFS